MDPQLVELRERLLGAIGGAASQAELQALEREALGKSGRLAELLAAVPSLPPAERPARGRAANALKEELRAALVEAARRLEGAELERERSSAGFDATLPGARAERGSLHPLTQLTRELEDLFTSMGYQVLDGPEVETEHYNCHVMHN